MAMPNLDPRQGGACLKCISNKPVSLIVGCVQVVVWILAFFTFICTPSLFNFGGGTEILVYAIIFIIVNIAFCVLLVLGVYHNRGLFVKIYLIYVMVYMVLVIISLIALIFIEPTKFIAIFFSILFELLLHLVYYFIVRCYYLMKYKNRRQNANSNRQALNPSTA